MIEPVYSNTLLQMLGPDIRGRLALFPVRFELGHEIEYPGKPIRHLFFVEKGVASMTTTFQDGAQVEVGLFGYESVIGISALMGTKRSLNRVYTQIEGHGYACPTELARNEFARGGRFQSLALRSVQTQLLQAMQSAACNAKHEVEQRLARWLLLCADRAHTNVFSISHEFLADMLGATRPTVSTSAAALRRQNLIEYTRGKMEILDPAGLERRACECYGVIKSHLDNFLEFDRDMVA